MRPLFIDGFAGGGGASTGIAQAIGRDVDIAINHSPSAIAIHKANHPGTEHFCQDIRKLWPRAAVGTRPVAGAWFSPDCKEFSKAKGGAVKDRHIRMLAMEIPNWLEETAPDVVYVENVEEFEDWGPLEEGADGKWRVITALKGEDFKRWLRKCRRLGYRIEHRQLRACDYGAPTSRKRLYIIMRRDKKPIVWPKPTHGRPDSPGVQSGKLLPYRTAAECIDWSIPCPSIFDRKKDLVVASKRRVAHGLMRFVVEAARPFIIPVTHSKGPGRCHDSAEPLRTITTANGGELAAIDVQIAPHITKYHAGSTGSAGGAPMPTVTANGKPARSAGAVPLGLVGATLYRTRNGERPGQEPRALDPQKPLGTVAAESSGFALATAAVAPIVDRQFGKSAGNSAAEPLGATTAGGGGKSAAVTAFLSSFYTSNTNGGRGDPRKPLKTACAGGQHHAIVAAHIEQANTGMVGRDARKPLSTIIGKGSTQRIVETTLIEEGALPPELMERAVKVAAFLVKYYATDGENETSQSQAVDRPIDVITGKARFAVVTVTIDAVTYVIVDIGLRMLTPRELARAQGFPDDYVLDPECWYVTDKGNRKFGRLPIALQISAIGNSVCPPVARALVAANQPELAAEMFAEAA